MSVCSEVNPEQQLSTDRGTVRIEVRKLCHDSALKEVSGLTSRSLLLLAKQGELSGGSTECPADGLEAALSWCEESIPEPRGELKWSSWRRRQPCPGAQVVRNPCHHTHLAGARKENVKDKIKRNLWGRCQYVPCPTEATCHRERARVGGL